MCSPPKHLKHSLLSQAVTVCDLPFQSCFVHIPSSGLLPLQGFSLDRCCLGVLSSLSRCSAPLEASMWPQVTRASSWTFPPDVLCVSTGMCWGPSSTSQLLSGSFTQRCFLHLLLCSSTNEIRMPHGPATKKAIVRKSFNTHIWAQIYNQCPLLTHFWTSSAY